MLLPRYTTRTALGLLTLAAVLSLVLSRAVAGKIWALGVVLAVASFAALALANVALFTLLWPLARFRAAREQARSTAPTRESLLRMVGLMAAGCGIALGACVACAQPAAPPTPPVPPAPPTAVLKVGPVLGVNIVAGAPPGALATAPLATAYGLCVAMAPAAAEFPVAGYLPVRVAIWPTLPLRANRRLRVRVEADGSFENQNAAETEVLLEAGSQGKEIELLLPNALCMSVVLRVFEGGGEREKLKSVTTAGTWRGVLPAQLPYVLAISSQEALSSGILEAVRTADPNSAWWWNNAIVVGKNKEPPELLSYRALESKAVSGSWLGYTSFDIVAISQAELAALHAARPEAHEAVLRWVSAGGNLVVGDVSPDAKGFAALETLLVWPRATEAPLESSADAGDSPWAAWVGWQPAKLTDFRRKVGSDDEEATTPEQPVTLPNFIEADAAAKLRWPEEPRPARSQLASRPLGLGRVVAVEGALFPSSPYRWAWVLNTLGTERWQSHRRNGASLFARNPSFWNFLIRGVGRAPVYAFELMITLLVIVIGPVNFFWLRRRKQLYWMLVTTPLLAGMASGGLILYALLADGLSVRLRARSFTLLDQRRQTASSVARLSYYAGMLPSGGLRFSSDVAVAPLAPVGGVLLGQRRMNQEIDWTADQHLLRGWIGPRTPAQLLTATARTTKAALRLRPGAAGQPLRATNELGTAIELLVVCDRDGAFHLARRVSAGAEVSLEATTPDAAVEALRKYHRAATLRADSSIDASGVGYARRAWQYSIQFQADTDEMAADSLLEANVLSTLEGISPLEPGEFVAVVERGLEVELGTAAARPEDSLHVVRGSW